jgi:hypothetical protein
MPKLTERDREVQRRPRIKQAEDETTERFTRMSKNLLNYPLARDQRVPMQWHRDRHGCYADLPGDDRIRLLLPGDAAASLRRCPTAFDINMLLSISAEANRSNRAEVSFDSRAALLATLSLAPIAKNLKRLEAALRYWSVISVEFYKCWYDVKDKQITFELQPPIRSYRRSQRFVVKLGEQWWKLINGPYFEAVPLPLPAYPVAQNIVLVSLVSHSRSYSNGADLTYDRRIDAFCQKIGLSHRRRLRAALAAANEWYQQHTGQLIPRCEHGRIRFVISKPIISYQQLIPELADADAAPSEPKAPWRDRRRSEPTTRRTSALPKERQLSDEDGYYHSMWEFPNGVLVDWDDANEQQRQLIRQVGG